MSFYPDEGQGDEIEIENQYAVDDIFDFEEKEKKDDEIFKIPLKPKNFNNEVKNTKERVGGIDKEELRKKIESFRLNPEKKLENKIFDSLDAEPKKISIVEDHDGVPIIEPLAEPEDKAKNLESDPGVYKAELKPKTRFDKKEKIDKDNVKKEYESETLAWYIRISRWPVFLIVLFHVLILSRNYFIGASGKIAELALKVSWIDNLKWPLEIIIFLILAYIIVKKRRQLPRIAGFTGAFIGFMSGVIIAVIKLFLYKEMWNIFYLSLEGIFMGLVGLLVGLLAGSIFYDEED